MFQYMNIILNLLFVQPQHSPPSDVTSVVYQRRTKRSLFHSRVASNFRGRSHIYSFALISRSSTTATSTSRLSEDAQHMGWLTIPSFREWPDKKGGTKHELTELWFSDCTSSLPAFFYPPRMNNSEGLASARVFSSSSRVPPAFHVPHSQFLLTFASAPCLHRQCRFTRGGCKLDEWLLNGIGLEMRMLLNINNSRDISSE